VVFLIINMLAGMKVYHIVVLICIALMICDVEHVFIYLLVSSMGSSEKFLFRAVAHVLIR
jgi:hypothetical protein